MAGMVHGGSLGRWYEELCRIKHCKLHGVVKSNGQSLASGQLPNSGGVYAFWWTGDRSLFSSEQCNRQIELHGPDGRAVMLEFDDEWLGLSTDLPIPLYIGKSAANISKRVGQHLRLKSERMLALGGSVKKAKPPTTTCQLRAGVEHLFPNETDTRTLILENVGLSYVLLDGDDNAANRFYLEDLAIGLMRTPINVDIER